MNIIGWLFIIVGVAIPVIVFDVFDRGYSLPFTEAQGFKLAIYGGGGSFVIGIGVLIYALVR